MSSSDPDCIFCKIVRHDAPASVVYEDDTTLAFMDLRPVIAGHTLVIPKAHGAYLEDLPEGGVGPILETARKVAAALRRSGLKCEAGQEVFHVHVHAIPRFRGDGFGLRAPPGSGRTAERNELDQVAAKIRGAIGRQ